MVQLEGLLPGRLGGLVGGSQSGKGLVMQPRKERAWWGKDGAPRGTGASSFFFLVRLFILP